MMNQAQALYVKGNQHLTAGELAESEACYRQALALDSLHGAARGNLAYLRELQGDLAEAELLYQLALALLPESARLAQNLGVLLLRQKRSSEAEAVLREALHYNPESVAVLRHLGVVLACAQRDDEAEALYRHALSVVASTSCEVAPVETARLRFNLAYVLMRQGRWAEGWPLLESRWEFDSLPQWCDGPRWQGEPLAGKSLLIGLEAGQGDMIHFCRYAALAKAEGAARIGVVCHPSLKSLFASMDGIDTAYASDEAPPREGWDFWTLPIAMPRWFATTPASIPAPIPYVHADPARSAYWRAQLPLNGLRIGLAWKGNPAFENDADRSIGALSELAPLWAAAPRADLYFVSLQKGPGEDEADGMPLFKAAPQLQDFADTAALMANLDLVIAVDSAVAHLAGALGKPCWLLLPDYRCDWRWLTVREDTPWYPHTRLFRQSRQGGWPEVIHRVAAELATWQGPMACPDPAPWQRR